MDTTPTESAPLQPQRILWLYHAFHNASDGKIPAARLEEQYETAWGMERKAKVRDLDRLREWVEKDCVRFDSSTRTWVMDAPFPLPLELHEAQALQLSLLILRSTQGADFKALELLESQVQGLPDEICHASVFPSTRLAKDSGELVSNHWLLLHEAIIQHRRVQFDYQSKEGTKWRKVDPLHLWWAQGGWYLLACMSHKPEERLTFALERMAQGSLKPCLDESGHPDLYPLDPGFDPRTWLGEGDWLFRGGPTAVARLRFDPDVAHSFQDRVWQQDARWNEEQSELLHPYPDNPQGEWEMARRVLGWGEYCEVLGPPSLRQRVRQLLADIAARYQD